jgi:hypothetical protein
MIGGSTEAPFDVQSKESNGKGAQDAHLPIGSCFEIWEIAITASQILQS